MPRANQNHETGPNSINYFKESPYRQYGSGFGAAIKAGLKGFVIPMVKRYGNLVAKSFLQQAALEVINILDGSTKPKAAMRNAVEKTIKKQVGGGRGGRITRPVPLRRSNTKKSSSQKRRTMSQKTSRKETTRQTPKPSEKKSIKKVQLRKSVGKSRKQGTTKKVVARFLQFYSWSRLIPIWETSRVEIYFFFFKLTYIF